MSAAIKKRPVSTVWIRLWSEGLPHQIRYELRIGTHILMNINIFACSSQLNYVTGVHINVSVHCFLYDLVAPDVLPFNQLSVSTYIYFTSHIQYVHAGLDKYTTSIHNIHFINKRLVHC